MHASELRALIEHRRAFSRSSRTFLEQMTADGADEDPRARMVGHRCAEHGNGKAPLLAQSLLVRGHVVFQSRIYMTARDRIAPPPWQVEHLLGAGIEESAWESLRQDDELLEDYARSVTNPTGDLRALIPSRKFPTRLHLAVPLTEPRPPVGLWVRCKDHPADAEALDLRRVVQALR